MGFSRQEYWSEVPLPLVTSNIWILRRVKISMQVHLRSESIWILALGSGLAERMCAYSVTQPCPTLCYPMDYKSPVSSVHGILQAKILEWVAISFSSRKDDTWSKTLCHFTISIYSHQIVWEESTLWLQQGLKLKLFFISTIIFLHQMYIN